MARKRNIFDALTEEIERCREKRNRRGVVSFTRPPSTERVFHEEERGKEGDVSVRDVQRLLDAFLEIDPENEVLLESLITAVDRNTLPSLLPKIAKLCEHYGLGDSPVNFKRMTVEREGHHVQVKWMTEERMDVLRRRNVISIAEGII